jgi:hypothetical protein
MKIVCIKKTPYMTNFTLGKVYDVIWDSPTLKYTKIVDDSGSEFRWFEQWMNGVDKPEEHSLYTYFKDLSEIRNNKLIELGI